MQSIAATSNLPKSLLYIRLAELENISDEQVKMNYLLAFQADSNSVESLYGIALSSTQEKNDQPWLDLWIRHEPSNSLPHYLKAACYTKESQFDLAFNEVCKGNDLAQVLQRPLYLHLLQKGFVLPEGSQEQARAELTFKSIRLFHIMIYITKNLVENADKAPNKIQPDFYMHLAKMGDLYACSMPLGAISFLQGTSVSESVFDKAK